MPTTHTIERVLHTSAFLRAWVVRERHEFAGLQGLTVYVEVPATAAQYKRDASARLAELGGRSLLELLPRERRPVCAAPPPDDLAWEIDACWLVSMKMAGETVDDALQEAEALSKLIV